MVQLRLTVNLPPGLDAPLAKSRLIAFALNRQGVTIMGPLEHEVEVDIVNVEEVTEVIQQ